MGLERQRASWAADGVEGVDPVPSRAGADWPRGISRSQQNATWRDRDRRQGPSTWMALLPPSAHRHRLSGGARRSVRGRRAESPALPCARLFSRVRPRHPTLRLVIVGSDFDATALWRSRICWRHHRMIAYGRPDAFLCRPRRRLSSWQQLGIGQSQEPQAQPTRRTARAFRPWLCISKRTPPTSTMAPGGYCASADLSSGAWSIG